MKKYGFPLYAIGYIIIIVAVVGFIFNPIGSLFAYIPYLFSIGATLSIIGRILTLPQSDDFRVRRLNNMLAVSAILIIGSAYLMFKGENLCILTLFISAFIDIYTSFRYPKEK
jgi:hypothetical protein